MLLVTSRSRFVASALAFRPRPLRRRCTPCSSRAQPQPLSILQPAHGLTAGTRTSPSREPSPWPRRPSSVPPRQVWPIVGGKDLVTCRARLARVFFTKSRSVLTYRVLGMLAIVLLDSDGVTQPADKGLVLPEWPSGGERGGGCAESQQSHRTNTKP
jgi:hypothetical protein